MAVSELTDPCLPEPAELPPPGPVPRPRPPGQWPSVPDREDTEPAGMGGVLTSWQHPPDQAGPRAPSCAAPQGRAPCPPLK